MRNVRTIVAVAAFAAMNLLLLGPGQPARAQAPAQRNLDAIKRDYVRPAPRPAANQALAGLGRDLFYDPRISASGKSSCAGCHTAELGYVVANAHPINDFGKPTARKSQPLIGIGYAGSARSAGMDAARRSKPRPRRRSRPARCRCAKPTRR